MSDFPSITKVLLTIMSIAVLTAGRVCAQTPDCSGQNQFGSNSTGSSNLSGPALNGHGPGSAIPSASNGSSASNGTPGTKRPSQPPAHTVSLSWKSSTSPHVVGYNIYRQQDSTPRQQLNSTPISGTSCVDSSVQNGHTYSYWARAINSSGKVSVVDSNVTTVTIQDSGSGQRNAPKESSIVSGKTPIQ